MCDVVMSTKSQNTVHFVIYLLMGPCPDPFNLAPCIFNISLNGELSLL